MSDMAPVIVPKSDQLSADSLLTGPLTITITGVDIRPGTEQPVAISYADDNGMPWKPCKSMSRVLVSAWGPDSKAYVGRSVTLYRDPKVKWGGMEVGGIRVSHLSHIRGDLVLALTATKGKRVGFTVKELRDAPPQQRQAPQQTAKAEPSADVDAVMAWAETLEDGLPFFTGIDELRADWDVHKAALKAADPERFRTLNLAIAKRAQEIAEAAKGGEE